MNMDIYWRLLFEIPAILSGTVMVAYLWPKRITPHFVPALMFLVALVVLALPAYIDLALAVIPLVAKIQQYLGIDLTNHEPVKVPDLTNVRNRLRLSKATLQTFVTRAYPAPGTEAPEPVPEPEPEPPEQREVRAGPRLPRRFVPEL